MPTSQQEGLSATLRPEARPLKLVAVHGGQQPRLIARQAVELLEVDMAILAYRECGDADRVAFLERLVQLEDVPMLQGYLRVLLGQYHEYSGTRGLEDITERRSFGEEPFLRPDFGCQ
ncbi:WD repeat-containing protein 19, partial [Perkinsus olseni]